MVKTVEDLDVFKLAHALAVEIYDLTKRFPGSERFGLTAQMRRAAYSIPSEGAHRLNSGEYRQFAGIARGSAGEMKYQLLLARALGYLSEDQYSDFSGRYERVSQMLTRLAQSLN
jgi:four helix bundle protein